MPFDAVSYALAIRHKPAIEPSYVILTEDGIVKAKNGMTGRIEFSHTDASRVLQYAIDSLPDDGSIFVKRGEYPLSKKVVLKDNITIIGEGLATRFKKLTNEATFYGMNVSNVILEKFFFDCNGLTGQPTTAYATAIGFDSDGTKPLYNIVLRDIKTYNGIGAHIHFWGIDNYLVNVYIDVYLENVECDTNPKTDTISDPLLILDYVNGATLVNCRAHDAPTEGGIAANGKNIELYNCSAWNCAQGLRIETFPRILGAGFVKVIGGKFFRNWRGIELFGGVFDSIRFGGRNVLIHGAAVYENSDTGILLWGIGHHKNIVISNCIIEHNGYPDREGIGILVQGSPAEDILIIGNVIRNNGFVRTECRNISLTAPGTEKKVKRVTIIGNEIYDDRDYPYVRWGIEFREGTIEDVVIVNNRFWGFYDEYITNSYGATIVNAVIRDNIGVTRLLTRNSGTATIPTGQTSVTVSHRLISAPTKVLVTPRANIGAVWVSARDATSFTIECSTTPESDVVVDWYAEL